MKTLYENARVYTGENHLQQAFLVEDGLFTAVGSMEDANSWQADERIDLGGTFVCPGFNDSHMHLLSYGNNLSNAPLHKHTHSLADMIDCLKATPPGRGGWIMGRGWNQDYFTDVNRMPNRYDLDQVSTDHPVLATRACGHALVLNSKALSMLHITGDTPQVPGGQIVMDKGEPTGVLFDNAMDLCYNHLPAPGIEDVKSMILSACKSLNAYGITSCQTDDYCVFHTLPWETVNQAYRELEKENALTVRVYEQSNFTTLPALQDFVEKGHVTGAGTDFFRIGPLKMLGDGALGARTAYLSMPYADDETTRGLSVFTPEEFDALISYAHEKGLQCAVHAIGDGCLDLVLSAMEKAQQQHPRQDHRHGIVHCQITRPDQLQKIADMHLHVYAQSIFLDYDIRIVKERAGDTLANTSYNWKTLMEKGVSVSNGSDCPVELPNVLHGMQCAVTRQDLKGCAPYLPDQAFTVQQALDSFTRWGAYASFEETKKGRIAPGMLADFTVLEKSPFDVPANAIKDIRILNTYVGGKCVYQA